MLQLPSLKQFQVGEANGQTGWSEVGRGGMGGVTKWIGVILSW